MATIFLTFKLFERKISIKMHIDEGGIPSGGSLSDYVREVSEGKMAAEAAKIEAERAAKQKMLEQRVNYEDFLDPFRSLFAHFSVIELLVEVKTRFWGGGLMSMDGISGIKLEHHSRVTLEDNDYISRTVNRLGDSIGNTSEHYGMWVKSGRTMPADLAKVMIVSVTGSESTLPASNYGLHCLYTQQYDPVSDFLYKYNQPLGRRHVLIDKVINAN